MSTCTCKENYGIGSTGYCPNCGGAKPLTKEQEDFRASFFSTERFGDSPNRERDTDGLIHEMTAAITSLRQQLAALTAEAEKLRGDGELTKRLFVAAKRFLGNHTIGYPHHETCKCDECELRAALKPVNNLLRDAARQADAAGQKGQQ